MNVVQMFIAMSFLRSMFKDLLEYIMAYKLMIYSQVRWNDWVALLDLGWFSKIVYYDSFVKSLVISSLPAPISTVAAVQGKLSLGSKVGLLFSSFCSCRSDQSHCEMWLTGDRLGSFISEALLMAFWLCSLGNAISCLSKITNYECHGCFGWLRSSWNHEP
jgi:hypothetical protein